MEGSDEEQTGIRIRPGYTEYTHNNETYIRPSMFEPGPSGPPATTRKPDLRQAIEIPGGVSNFLLLFKCAVWQESHCLVNGLGLGLGLGYVVGSFI